jgi:uncharacterized protein (TIGR00369 family)
MTLSIPDGFKPLDRAGPFLSSLGPWYYRLDDQGQLIMALRIEERHTNIRHIAHGGLLVSMADTALGIVLSHAPPTQKPMVTVSLTTDFIESAQPGDWVEAHVDVIRVGGRLAYGTCFLKVGKRRILRASAVFAVMKPIVPKEDSEG